MPLLGVLILARHGDRNEIYQDPYTYQAGLSQLTTLGETQSLHLGGFLRSQYLSPGSASFIGGISTDLADHQQIAVHADNGAEGSVIVDSATALLQGLYPPTPRSKDQLANGTTVVGPFGGYQYIPIKTDEPDQSIAFEGWSSCPAFQEHIKKFYSSPQFKQKAEDAAPFFHDLSPFLYGRSATLENAWNIYDFVNVNFIHNETYAFRLPPTYLSKAKELANFHEHGVFTGKTSESIGNVAGRTILPSVLNYLERIANPRDPLRIVVEEISYKPFISLFNVTGIDERYPELKGIPEYASALALELHNNEEGETFLRAKFKNGHLDGGFRTLHLWGHKEDVALNEFVYRLNLAAIKDLPEWCSLCGQSSARGCAMCSADLVEPPKYKVPMIESGAKVPGLPLIGEMANNWSFLAIFIIFMFTLFGVRNFFRSRRSAARLSGYDPLPIVAQYADEAPAPRKGKQFM